MVSQKSKNKAPHYRVDQPKQAQEDVELEPCVSMVIDAWDSWSDHWASRLSDFEGYYDRWYGVAPKRDEEWQAKFHKRLTFQATSALIARIHGALFPTSAPIDTEVTKVTNQLQSLLAKSIVAHWFKIGQFILEFLSGIRSAAIYGTGLFEDDWYVRKEIVHEKKVTMMPDFRPMVGPDGQQILDDQGRVKSSQVGQRPLEQTNKKLKVVEDRYRLRKANIFSWRVHPNKLNDDDDYPVIKQEFITYDTLLERQKELEKYGIDGFENMEVIKEDKYKIKDEDARRFNKEGEYTDEKDPRIELLTYWGLYVEQDGDQGYKKGAEKRPVFIMVVNRKYRIQLKDNPFWHQKSPLFHIVWNEDEKPSYYGIGIAQTGADAEDRANRVVNIRTDVRSKNLRGGGWYNALDKKIKKTELQKNVPGLWRTCSNVNEAYKPDIPIPTDPADYQEEEIAVNDHREITGASVSLAPTGDGKQQHKTLGGLELLLGKDLQRLKPDLQNIEIMGIRKAANRAFLMTRQFYSQTETIELLASEDQAKALGVQKIYQLSPQQIIGDVQFFCTGLSESIDKNQNIEKLIQYMEITGKIPQMAQITNYQEIGKQIMAYLNLENSEKFFQPPPPPPQPEHKGPNESINFKDLDVEGKIQMAASAGIKLTPQGIAHQDFLNHQAVMKQKQAGQAGDAGLPNGNGAPPQAGGLPPGLLGNIPPELAAAINARLGMQQ